MNEQTVKVTLPNSVYDRIRMTAQASSLTAEEVIKQSVTLLLPAFESDMPLHLRLSLAGLALLDDIQLWKAANTVMHESRQIQLEKLAELQKHRSLTKIEHRELDKLTEEAQQIMLYKAEARRLLAQRGHTVFASVED
ncbi:hypothetical protein QUF90_26020 [Desulfococcaceae bacterium HSG9]|nr:hypothetical protein [Desulfococcaceae bacterium HSG9]